MACLTVASPGRTPRHAGSPPGPATPAAGAAPQQQQLLKQHRRSPGHRAPSAAMLSSLLAADPAAAPPMATAAPMPATAADAHLLKATLAKAQLADEPSEAAAQEGLIPAYRQEQPAPVPAAAAAERPRPRTKLLALCPTVPPAMQREGWCMSDYVVLEKLYKGYASKGARRGGGPACLPGAGREPLPGRTPSCVGRRAPAAAPARPRARPGARPRQRRRLTLAAPTAPATRPPSVPPSPVYKAICKRSREVVVLKCYQLSAICELYQHQIFR
jgi:hypothetical protein